MHGGEHETNKAAHLIAASRAQTAGIAQRYLIYAIPISLARMAMDIPTVEVADKAHIDCSRCPFTMRPPVRRSLKPKEKKTILHTESTQRAIVGAPHPLQSSLVTSVPSLNFGNPGLQLRIRCYPIAHDGAWARLAHRCGGTSLDSECVCGAFGAFVAAASFRSGVYTNKLR